MNIEEENVSQNEIDPPVNEEGIMNEVPAATSGNLNRAGSLVATFTESLYELKESILNTLAEGGSIADLSGAEGDSLIVYNIDGLAAVSISKSGGTVIVSAEGLLLCSSAGQSRRVLIPTTLLASVIDSDLNALVTVINELNSPA